MRLFLRLMLIVSRQCSKLYYSKTVKTGEGLQLLAASLFFVVFGLDSVGFTRLWFIGSHRLAEWSKNDYPL
jgi:hypothetical protein